MSEAVPEPRMFVLRQDAGDLAVRRGMNNPPDPAAPADLEPDAAADTTADTDWTALDLTDDRYATPPAPPDLHPLIYSGLRHALSGPPEATKTLLSYAILLDIIRAGHHVAIVDFEMGANRARILLDDLGATRNELRQIRYYQDVERPPTDNDINDLHQAGVKLVLIDSSVGAFDASGLDDNARKDVEAWAKAWIRPLFNLGIATLVLDHVVKNADNRGKFTIGSERKTGGVDVHLGAEPVTALRRGGQALIKIRTHKDRGGYLERPHACHVDINSAPDTHQLTVTLKPADSSDDDGHFRPTGLMQKISRYLEEHGQPASHSVIMAAVKGKTDYKIDAIAALVREGYAEQTKGPRNANIVTLIRQYREDTDPLLVVGEGDISTPTATSPRPLPDLSPGEVISTSPLSPPYRGRGEVEDAPGVNTTSTSPLANYDPKEIERLEQLARTYGIGEDEA